MQNILFLGYSKDETQLIGALESNNCRVEVTDKKIDLDKSEGYDLIISFGYSYIIPNYFIEKCSCPIVNLHISYLPFNRGAHPNFWSFYDHTQSGVTIHLIDDGIDTGPILFQKKVNFSDETTFSETYQKLINEIEKLFMENLQSIIEKNWVAKPQKGGGTFHRIKDLPNGFRGWDSNIDAEIYRLKYKNENERC